MPRFASGVVMWNMAPQIEVMLDEVDAVHKRIAKRPALITSAREGTHAFNSPHLKGRALKLGTSDLKHGDQIRLASALRIALGADFNVVLEPASLRIEFEPV